MRRPLKSIFYQFASDYLLNDITSRLGQKPNNGKITHIRLEQKKQTKVGGTRWTWIIGPSRQPGELEKTYSART